jgi:NADPH:quinone reductase-like Zn-dependent oxidoreductase
MRAMHIKDFGVVEKVQVGDLPKPAPGFGQALLKVKTAALNHLDIWVRKGRPGLQLKGPHILGSDAAGTIEDLGLGCEGFGLQRGQNVLLNPGVSCMLCEFCLRGMHSECPSFRIIGFQLQGVFAEYAVVPAINLFPKPESLSWEEAAALPLSHLTAWRMLFERAKLLGGETVLIHGIGGGVAMAALQLARIHGASAIVTSSSDEKLKQARQHGADETINYKTCADVAAAVKKYTNNRGVDVVIDTTGAPTLPISMASVRRGGRIVTCGVTGGPEAPINIQQLYWNHISFMGSTMGSMEDMRRLVRTTNEFGLKPLIDKVFDLNDGAEAMKRMEAGEQMGKIVLQLS